MGFFHAAWLVCAGFFPIGLASEQHPIPQGDGAYKFIIIIIEYSMRQALSPITTLGMTTSSPLRIPADYWRCISFFASKTLVARMSWSSFPLPITYPLSLDPGLTPLFF